jgi:plasmid stabilization system protein ParE
LRCLQIQPQARVDTEQAALWYEQQRAGLGSEFLLELNASLDRAMTNPGLYQVQYHEVRRILMRRFPYAVYFFAAADVIEVLAVLHQQRASRAWQDRAP